ncbi:MAG: PP2C family protein-serine/threonine phosphatase [Candidatus Binatia bacterium]
MEAPAVGVGDGVAERGRVLIVDDNEINRRVLSGILRKEGYTLSSAADGELALALARREQPDLILLDVMMPGMDGYAVCAALKADPLTVRIPVLFLSALAEAADKIKGLELGAVDYVTKPFNHGEVLARVRSQLKIRRLTSDLLRANRELEEKQARLEEDLQAAAMIQRSMMPKVAPALERLALAWRFMPCERVGGDLLNFSLLPEGVLSLQVIDVSGHGVPAAMVAVSLAQYLSPQTGHLLQADGAAAAPAEVLERLEREYPIERFDKYLTAAYALVDDRSGTLRYSLAGHPRPVLVRAGGGVEMLGAGGPLIGLGFGLPFEEGRVRLAAGDRVFFHTDGIVECENPRGEAFGEAQLNSVLRGTRHLSLDAACDQLVSTLLLFGGGRELQDDVSLLAIEFRGAG